MSFVSHQKRKGKKKKKEREKKKKENQLTISLFTVVLLEMCGLYTCFIWCGVGFPFSVGDLLCWKMAIVGKRKKKAWILASLCVMWIIWGDRN